MPNYTMNEERYLMVGGKMTKVRKGAQVELTADAAKGLGDVVLEVGKGKPAVKVDEPEPKADVKK